MQITHVHSDDEFWARVTQSEDSLRASFGASTTFGLTDWPSQRFIGRWDLAGGIRSLGYASTRREPRLTVYTTAAPSGSDVTADSRRFVSTLRFEPLTEQASRFLAERAADDPETLPDGVADVDIDGTPVVFETWDDADGFWGVGLVGAHMIAVHAAPREPPVTRLCRVTDIEPYISGRHEWIRVGREQATSGA